MRGLALFTGLGFSLTGIYIIFLGALGFGVFSLILGIGSFMVLWGVE